MFRGCCFPEKVTNKDQLFPEKQKHTSLGRLSNGETSS